MSWRVSRPITLLAAWLPCILSRLKNFLFLSLALAAAFDRSKAARFVSCQRQARPDHYAAAAAAADRQLDISPHKNVAFPEETTFPSFALENYWKKLYSLLHRFPHKTSGGVRRKPCALLYKQAAVRRLALPHIKSILKLHLENVCNVRVQYNVRNRFPISFRCQSG